MPGEEKFASANCPCKQCPSYVDCGELAFCVKGKSKCVKEERGCLCPGCPVQAKLGFSSVYYCTRGAAKGGIK